MALPSLCRDRVRSVLATSLLLLGAWPAVAAAGERPTAHAATLVLQQSRTSAPRRTTPATPVRATPAKVAVLTHTTPRSADALRRDLASMLGAKTRNGQWGALVVSLTTGDTLFSVSPDTPLVPASTMKTFTAALALETLGPEHAFATDVLRDGPLEANGTVRGNLVLRGDGDPGLSPRFVRGGPEAPMELLARFVAGAGVTRVEGDLIADASGMEGRRIPDGWLSRYAGAAYAAPFSALSLNENIVIVGVYPAKDGSASVRLEPASTGLEVVSSVRIVAGRATAVQVRMIGESQVVVTGTIGTSAAPHRVQLVVSDPVTFAAGAFAEALRAQGITVTGSVRIGRTPELATVVTSLPSPPLARLVSVMNRESVNHFAEQIFRNAARGVDRRGAGTAEAASAQLRAFLEQKVGVPGDHVTAADGSGLSVLDRVTPRALVRLMHYAHQAPWASVFHASLPVAGESETLRLRMRNTPAQGNLHAKTGTTNDVISLAGYATAENGELLAFAFLYNGADRWNARETIDAMGPTLAGFSR
jgi:D-alanyl-D-alanine carboxypeptidase/D-alanyl-D-alanine-endopeptidase (penicillin-binding protein 4)